jgi:hypothetical protein
MIRRYVGYLKNTFWNRTPYHAFRFRPEDNRTGIEPRVEEKEVEENTWRKFYLFIITSKHARALQRKKKLSTV